jgi:inorganic pyrophosphatase
LILFEAILIDCLLGEKTFPHTTRKFHQILYCRKPPIRSPSILRIATVLQTSFDELSPFYERTTRVNVVVETSKGSSLKLKYDEEAQIFRAHKAMPVGFTFPFSFGFIPNTIGGDGDPLDALILSDYEMPPGTIVVGQIIAVLEAEQKENRKPKQRNDRLIVLPWDLVAESPMLPEVSFDQTLKHAINDFFTKYNEAQGKEFRPLSFASARRGLQLTRQAVEEAKNKQSGSNGSNGSKDSKKKR